MTAAIENLRNHVGLTVNGFALSFRDITAPNWIDKLITLPGALEDLRAKQLRVNREGYKDQAANFFACLRFMSAGFNPPPADEVQLLLNELPRVEHERYENNVQKVYNYVGGEQRARELVRSLDIDIDVFDEDVVKGK